VAKVRIYRSPSLDIFLNLALEDRLFRTLAPGERCLFLWRNDRAVVIGRYQYPWLECRAAEIERDGVALARRQSGGGTVWHDRGNLCFTFMGDQASFDRKENIRLVVDTLRELGLEAESNERLDILAFRESSGKSFHHGTLLVSSDLAALKCYLAPGGVAHQAKGVKSIRSPVANLSDSMRDLTVERLEKALAAKVREVREPAGASTAIEDLDIRSFAEEGAVIAERKRLMSREWRFAASPPFTRRLEVHSASLVLEVEGGAVREVLLEGGATAAASVAASLKRLEYDEKRIGAILRSLGSLMRTDGDGTAGGTALPLGPEEGKTLAALAKAIEEGRFS
jgi:lipoate-protein ligase A